MVVLREERQRLYCQPNLPRLRTRNQDVRWVTTDRERLRVSSESRPSASTAKGTATAPMSLAHGCRPARLAEAPARARVARNAGEEDEAVATT